MNMEQDLLKRIYEARKKADSFFDSLESQGRSKYTVNHDVLKFPSACLYGAWSRVCGKILISENVETTHHLESIVKEILSYKTSEGLFFPDELWIQKPAKSYEYLKLHTYNYAAGALRAFDSEIDLSSSFMDWYLNPEHLQRWLDARSFSRPWEESNNIVNVASYLAWKSETGCEDGVKCLEILYNWHHKYQDPKTGGFGNLRRSYNPTLQSMAGAVHNFHIHHYLDMRMQCENVIASNVIPYLFEGPLTACLSIDFVELGVYSLPYIKDSLRRELIAALLFHAERLLAYQRNDGGWLEGEDCSSPTAAAGMKENSASSCSYATWFRLCSLGMVAISLLGDKDENWHFRNTLGMGYLNTKLLCQYEIPSQLDVKKIRVKYLKTTKKGRIQKRLIRFASKFI